MQGNLVLASITIVFSLFFFIVALQLPPSPSPMTLGPGFWPKTILLLMFIMGVILFIRSLRERAKASREKEVDKNIIEKSEEVEEEFAAEIVHKTKFLHVLAVLIVATLLMSYLGYIVTTILFIIAIAFVIGVRKWLPVIITSVIGTAVATYLFGVLLNIALPKGIGIFRSLSEIFY